jgi:hypothetical protein
MINDAHDYKLFFKFIESYSKVGFKGIDRNDSLLLQLEAMMERHNQFFFVGDIIKIQILFTSKRSVEMIGVIPEEVTPYNFFEATHPDDIQRHNLARSKLFGLAHGLYIAERGEAVMSTNFKIRNPYEGFTQMLFQDYMFYEPEPHKTVYVLQIQTNIDWYKKIKHGYHYYIGNDVNYFKYPDDELLMMGNIFSDREFEIIKLIHSGLDSEQIAEKLFLSKHTINSHRSNILEKSGKVHIYDLIYDLKERGLL